MAGKKFRFSLDSVLHLREHETQAAREELASVLRQKLEQEARVEEAHHHLDDLLRAAPTGAVDQRSLRQFDAYRREAQQACAEAEARLRHLGQLEEEARVRLMEKRSAEEALRHLYEQEAAQHRKDEDLAETNFLDETALSSYYRQRKAAHS
jgi:flagellar FliJ protein